MCTSVVLVLTAFRSRMNTHQQRYVQYCFNIAVYELFCAQMHGGSASLGSRLKYLNKQTEKPDTHNTSSTAYAYCWSGGGN